MWPCDENKQLNYSPISKRGDYHQAEIKRQLLKIIRHAYISFSKPKLVTYQAPHTNTPLTHSEPLKYNNLLYNHFYTE